LSQLLHVHPENPQRRLLQIAADALAAGGLVAYPTDTSYALACHIGDKRALERIVALRRLSKNHQFTLACRDLSELGVYARVDNSSYRLLKRATPGPFTFILRATKEVPKRLVHTKRRTIGIRVPDHPVAQLLLEMMGEPIMTTTLRLAADDPEAGEPFLDGEDIAQRLGKRLDVVIDAGACGLEETTVVDLTEDVAEIVRQGKGELDAI
jgi:tRNA threonylcarbamoyl adenosine modification protein (Sua5/YciO/YrdC/YwlC family)